LGTAGTEPVRQLASSVVLVLVKFQAHLVANTEPGLCSGPCSRSMLKLPTRHGERSRHYGFWRVHRCAVFQTYYYDRKKSHMIL
jgi:hypothetical protein